MTKTIRRSSFRHSLANAHDKGGPATTATPIAEVASTPTPPADVVLSKKTTALLEEVKVGFGAFSSDFNLLTSGRAELAPRFMRAFEAWQKETAGTFVAFVRILDPALPNGRNDYRNHSSYQAALYLQGLATRGDKPAVVAGKAPIAPLRALARVLATILPLIDDKGILWATFLKQLHWSPAQVAKLQHMVDSEKALMILPGQPKLRKAA